MPSVAPMVVYTFGYWAMYIRAATAARPAPMPKVMMMVWFTLMPMSVAASLSSETHRMAQPIRAFWVKRYSATIMAADTSTVIMVAWLTATPPME